MGLAVGEGTPVGSSEPFLKKVYRRLRGKGMQRSAIYAAGRFRIVRLLSKLSLRLSFRVLTPALASVIPFDAEAAFGQIRRDAIFVGISLKPEALDDLLLELSTAQRFDKFSKARIDADVLAAACSRGEPVLTATYESQQLSTLVDRVARDPQLLQLAQRYMGGPPRAISAKVQEHFVTDASISYRESKRQTVLFHYDVFGLDSLYVFFFLTDCDALSGPHEMMMGTHRKKKLSYLLGSAKQLESEIYSYYGQHKSVLITGKAGSGFVEDTSCFHRLHAPMARSRISLQIRYSA